MPTPQVELKRVSINSRLSEETICYSADLYIDGVKAGSVGNRGCGGPDEVHLTGAWAGRERELNDLIRANYPRIESQYFPEGLEADLELVCHGLVETIDHERQIVRAIAREKKKATIVHEGKILQFKRLPVPLDVRARTMLGERYPGCTILNGMPDATWIEAYRKANLF